MFVRLDFFILQILGKVQLPDFDAYFRLVKDIRAGINPYTVSYMQTLGPPSVFIYYLPFSFTNLETARAVSTSVNFLSGLFANFLLAKNLFYKKRKIIFLVLNLLLFSSFPARFSLEMGQPNLFLMFLVAILITRKKDSLTAFISSLLIALKTFFIFIPFSFLKERKKEFLKVILFLSAITLAFLPIIIFDAYYLYFSEKLSQIVSTGNRIVGLDYYNQSYGSTLARLGVNTSSKSYYSILIPLAAFLVYRLKSIEVAVIAGVILSFVSWQHYYVILFPVFVSAFKRLNRIGVRTVFLAFLFLFWWVEFPQLHYAEKSILTGILASHYFLSAFLLGLYVLLEKKLRRLTNWVRSL